MILIFHKELYLNELNIFLLHQSFTLLPLLVSAANGKGHKDLTFALH